MQKGHAQLGQSEGAPAHPKAPPPEKSASRQVRRARQQHAGTDDAQGAAQDTAQVDQSDRLNEIVVTALRRDSNLQSTPVAISAVDSTLIRQASPRDLGDLAAFVPNFSANTITNFNAASFAMRGVGQTSITVHFEPPVAARVDDFAASERGTGGFGSTGAT